LDRQTSTTPPRSIGTAVLGAGPAGLTAGHVLGLRGRDGAIFEADDVVGGLARTVRFKDYRFDLGGHRFFTKLRPVERLWEEMLGDEFLLRPRLSRIYYNGGFFAYPLEVRDVIKRLGLVESFLCATSYAWNRVRPRKVETFEDWVVVRFGRRLYNAFFRSYTEKVWGIPGSELKAEWAAQRIKNFSLAKAAFKVVGLSGDHVTTLIEEFRYPRLGPGQMWETFSRRAGELGVPTYLHHRCESVRHRDGRVESVTFSTPEGTVEVAVEDGVVSSIPLSELVLKLEPSPPEEILAAARELKYRELVLVALVIDEAQPFPDNWIYLHDPGVRAGRVQNFGAWSEGMVVPGHTCLGVEYFCFRGDEIWEMPEDEAVAMATRELASIGLINPARVIDGKKVPVPRAYPIYDSDHKNAVDLLREYLGTFQNLQVCGRNGLHRYNNQDHSMWTAILATLNLVEGSEYDVWSVNTEAEYLEEGEIVDELLSAELVG